MKRILILVCSAALLLTASSAMADRHVARSHANAARVRSAITRGGPIAARHAIASRRWIASHNNWNNNWRRHHTRFVFVGSFGYPFWASAYPYYWYPSAYYSYYPYNYYSAGPPVNGDNSYGRGGSIVLEVQRRLARDGYYQGSLDGAMGSRTHYAIRAFKRSHGLHVDGEIDDELLGTMGLR